MTKSWEATILPFLQPKRVGAMLIAKHKLSTGGSAAEPQQEEGESHPGVMSAAEDLISAVHAKDATAVAKALEDAFALLDSGDAEAAEPQV